MKEIRLRKSDVSFDIAAHRYWMPDGRELSGVTKIVGWVYPKTYEGISEEVLQRAQEHGTSVHLDCQMSDAGFDVESTEAKAYQRLKAEMGLETLANEWLVDDGGRVASSIDVVFTDGSIADIKTTSQIHFNNVSLQLSIYAWMLERMNEGLVVPQLYVIWLPKERYGKPQIVRVDRIASEKIERLVDAYAEGKDGSVGLDILSSSEGGEVVKMDNQLQALRDAEMEFVRLMKEADEIKQRTEKLRAGMLEVMESTGTKKYESDVVVLTYKEAYEQERLDSAKLKKLYPDIYQECVKVAKYKPSITIKIK